jgi:predicted enzyme related to lactoylglutathione lyase
MSSNVKYVHTNLIAKNWKLLAEFYCTVFECKVKPPERDLEGVWLDRLTSIENAHIKGVHLSLPGYKKNGPTLEIFEYSRKKTTHLPEIDMPGFAHIAFSVEDVGQMLEKVERNGGSRVGDVVNAEIANIGPINLVYARDPEGNIIELQKWG